jgi:hypothetical protein
LLKKRGKVLCSLNVANERFYYAISRWGHSQIGSYIAWINLQITEATTLVPVCYSMSNGIEMVCEMASDDSDWSVLIPPPDWNGIVTT